MKSKLAIWSLALSLAPIVLLIFTLLTKSQNLGIVHYFAIVAVVFLSPILSIVLGSIALTKIKKNNKLRGKKLAFTAIIISIIYMIIFYIGLFILSMGLE